MSAIAAVAFRSEGATDADLVAAVRAGDSAAFEELYRRHRAPVNAFVRRIVKDEGRAEDVTQEAFLSALRSMRRTDRPIAFRPWMYEIARNASIDAYRRGSRAQEVSIDTENGLAASDARRLNGGVGPDATVIHKERFDHLRGALDELSESHHQIVVMRELEGLSYREIGERMELSPSAVESTLFRARRRLEHEYDQLSTGSRCLSMSSLIGRVAEGSHSSRDRRRLDRHARRCSNCCRHAREMGVEPIVERGSIAARVAGLLPFPFLGRRAVGGSGQPRTADLQHSLAGVAAAPGIENGVGLVAKGVAFVAAAALVGGGGATLGGVGPIAPSSNTPPASKAAPPRSKPAPGSSRRSTDAQPARRAVASPSAQKRAAGGHRGDDPSVTPTADPRPGAELPGATPAPPAPAVPSAPPAPESGALGLEVPAGSTTSAPTATPPNSPDLGAATIGAVQGLGGTVQRITTAG